MNMKRLTIEINLSCGNSAFVDNGPQHEVKKILMHTMCNLDFEADCEELRLKDSNGNSVGTAIIFDDGKE
jgi:hypothetical protein